MLQALSGLTGSLWINPGARVLVQLGRRRKGGIRRKKSAGPDGSPKGEERRSNGEKGNFNRNEKKVDE
jgi:hypothetical protein